MSALPARSAFPPGFLFGLATSAYQIEGHGLGAAGPTHWDTFAATPGNVLHAENGARACEHYHLWAQDLDLVAAAGFDIYRFSTSWARVMPEGRGAVNAQGLDFYDRLVDGMLARGLKPALTLYHWELPAALADLGGWCNRDIAGWLADFAQVIARRLGDRIWSAAPINEPWCVSWLSHFLGLHAPGLRDIRAAARAMHHTGLAHGHAIASWRAEGMTNLGAVCNFEPAIPADPAPSSLFAAKRYDAIFNRFFIEGMLKGRYPEDALERLEAHLPRGWAEDMNGIAAPLDWLGVNYYTCKRIAAATGPWPAWQEIAGPGEKTAMGWEIRPEGLRDLLIGLARDYTGALPLLITENGIATADVTREGACDDSPRIAYHAAHLEACRAAIAAGVPLAGYIAWSALDNFEWAEGYSKRFGLVHVDFESLQRTPKASYHAFRQALER
ncbi:GH1 family beta-glucosidase [Rhodobacter maris]|uniref:Beta-glucosidase n=1 Tax=Rhodobacter maris TaxID=446682 RepID=A0A285SVT4_9RHOB|nr:GH1 family beta-glucosidase [Rhodobacter maris]SOC12112.1 beta-glucosidase [Rhodobacter maris]